jgi:hypothetical protein
MGRGQVGMLGPGEGGGDQADEEERVFHIFL